MNNYIVSAECPSCSAPLDFSEGSNAVECGHCRSRLMVTGRRQVLSYFIRPKVDHYRAIAAAMKSQQEQGYECRVIKPQIYFIPYYRLVGNDFRWEEAPRVKIKPDMEYGQPGGYGADDMGEDIGWGTIFRHADDIVDIIFGSKVGGGIFHAQSYKTGEFAVPPAQDPGPLQIQLADRYVERNFIACNLHGEGLYSLGLRPAVLRLELFQKSVLGPLGKIVNPDLGIDEAMAGGMKTAAMQPLLYRSVIGRILSIIYFPFWVIEMERGNENICAIVDAVSQSVIKPDAPSSIYAVLDHAPQSEPGVIGFRPLSCPNCGWDLPLRPDDAIFYCSSCARVWQINGSELSELRYQIARPDKTNGPAKHLPFWVLDIQAEGEPQKFYIPAFRFRRLKMLADLALNMTRINPVYEIDRDEKNAMKEMQGCLYDSEDAFILGQFVHAGLKSKNADEMRMRIKDEITLRDATLTWFPFAINGCNLVDPFTGTSIPQSLLL